MAQNSRMYIKEYADRIGAPFQFEEMPPHTDPISGISTFRYCARLHERNSSGQIVSHYVEGEYKKRKKEAQEDCAERLKQSIENKHGLINGQTPHQFQYNGNVTVEEVPLNYPQGPSMHTGSVYGGMNHPQYVQEPQLHMQAQNQYMYSAPSMQMHFQEVPQAHIQPAGLQQEVPQAHIQPAGLQQEVPQAHIQPAGLQQDSFYHRMQQIRQASFAQVQTPNEETKWPDVNVQEPDNDANHVVRENRIPQHVDTTAFAGNISNNSEQYEVVEVGKKRRGPDLKADDRERREYSHIERNYRGGHADYEVANDYRGGHAEYEEPTDYRRGHAEYEVAKGYRGGHAEYEETKDYRRDRAEYEVAKHYSRGSNASAMRFDEDISSGDEDIGQIQEIERNLPERREGRKKIKAFNEKFTLSVNGGIVIMDLDCANGRNAMRAVCEVMRKQGNRHGISRLIVYMNEYRNRCDVPGCAIVRDYPNDDTNDETGAIVKIAFDLGVLLPQLQSNVKQTSVIIYSEHESLSYFLSSMLKSYRVRHYNCSNVSALKTTLQTWYM